VADGAALRGGAGGNGSNPRAFVAWFVSTDAPDTLSILALRAPDAAAASALLRRAQAAAARAGLARVKLWDASLSGLERLVPGGRREPRKGKLPMVLQLREGLAPEGLCFLELGVWY
jgi:hypothetical protein